VSEEMDKQKRIRDGVELTGRKNIKNYSNMFPRKREST
jgi:hypothetical protein